MIHTGVYRKRVISEKYKIDLGIVINLRNLNTMKLKLFRLGNKKKF